MKTELKVVIVSYLHILYVVLIFRNCQISRTIYGHRSFISYMFSIQIIYGLTHSKKLLMKSQIVMQLFFCRHITRKPTQKYVHIKWYIVNTLYCVSHRTFVLHYVVYYDLIGKLRCYGNNEESYLLLCVPLVFTELRTFYSTKVFWLKIFFKIRIKFYLVILCIQDILLIHSIWGLLIRNLILEFNETLIKITSAIFLIDWYQYSEN